MKSILSSIKNWLAIGNRSKWFTFIVFAFFLFIKCVCFHFYAFHSILISSCWERPLVALAFYLPKMAFAILFASVVFLTKKSSIPIILSFIVDIWCVANLVYVRSNNLLLDAYAFTMVNNMNGFWDSIFMFFEKKDIIFPLLSIVFAFCVKEQSRNKKRLFVGWLCVFAMFITFHYGGEKCHLSANSIYESTPFVWNTIKRDSRSCIYSVDFRSNVELTSILQSPFFVISDYFDMVADRYANVSISKEDEYQINALFSHQIESVSVQTPLILLVVESFENWVLRPDIMPNISRWMEHNNHMLYVPHVIKQTIGAESADGQMIINTGMLPVSEGATCFRFPFNEYPAIMKCIDYPSVTLLPHETDVWNQTYMSPAFGYDTTIVCSAVDSILFGILNTQIEEGYKCIQCITMSTHSPFSGCKNSLLQTPHGIHPLMSDYIKAFNALDDGWKQFFDKFETDSAMQQYTIVITGDHSIFHQEKRDAFRESIRITATDYQVEQPFIPLIVYSPTIDENICVTDTCYQMDIFPTILSLIGAEDYYWHGFGVNVMDSTARHNRLISEDDAYHLSDLMIRSDYFRQYMNK